MNMQQPTIRKVTALQCYLAYALAMVSGLVTWRLIHYYGWIENPYWAGLAVTVVATLVVWIFSIANNNSSIYDPYWVIAPPLLAVLLVLDNPAMPDMRQYLVLACLILWASRYHIFYKWSGWRTGLKHEDWRYEMMREAPLPYWLNSLLGMHLFPTFLVYFAFAPMALVLILQPALQIPLGIWDIIACILAMSAVLIQLVSDEQLRKYRQSDEYKNGGTFRSGLWNYSRHPNYFGEVLFWISGIFFALGAGLMKENAFLILAGPLAMAVFFRYSAYLTDKRSLKRRPAYAQVMKEVSALVPWKKASGKATTP